MRIFYDNLIDYSGVFISGSSENTAFPISNVVNQHRENPWRTGATVAAEFVQFDLGSAKSVTSLIVISHNLTPSDTLLKIEANTTSSFVAPAFSQAVTWESGVISSIFAVQSYRYWRFSFTKSASGETRDIGRIFLGTSVSMTERPDYDGWKRGQDDLSIVQRTVGGQVYAESRPKFRMADLDFSGISNAQKIQFTTLGDRVGTHTSWFLQIDENGSGEVAEILYVNLKDLPQFSIDGFDSDYTWNTQLKVEEQI
jgi:hypothetical protein